VFFSMRTGGAQLG